MQITRNTLDTNRGPSDWFTGAVYVDTIAAPSEDSRIAAACVRFTPGARTAGHTHPHGQTIWVTEGVGVCQREGGPIEVIRPGDRVFFEPGENHWHGAAPARFMTHIAIQQANDAGEVVAWGEHVSDEQYGQAPSLMGGRELMRGAVMYAPGDVRVEERSDSQIVEATGRDHSPAGDVYLRLGPLAVPRARHA